jgi:hypothetical protein
MSSNPRILAALALGVLAACNPWQRDVDFFRDSDSTLWDADVVAAGDAVYVRMPRSKALMRVQTDGTMSTVDLQGAEPNRVVATPDGEGVLVFTSWPYCEDTDPKIELVSDCPEDDLITRSELALVRGAGTEAVFDVPLHLNALAFSGDGQTAVAYLDYSRDMDIEVDGLIDLGEVMFIPLAGGEPRSVSVGFSPEKVLFSTNAEGEDDKAVIFSRSEVVVVELATLATLVTYPLVLDADQVVDPQDAVLTTRGNIALVAIDNSSDLYELDLEKFSIDLEELDGEPIAMANAVLPGIDDGSDADVTLIAYPGLARVDVLDQDTLELREPFELEEPVTDLLVTPTNALMYNKRQDDAKDVYDVDLSTYEIIEYRVANPLDSLQLAPGEDYAVGILRPETDSGTDLDRYQDERWGLAIIDLVDQEETSLVLEAQPIGVALLNRDDATYALVLMQGREHLLQVKLSEPTFFTEVELQAPPIQIGDMQDGRFYITHDATLGLVSFLDPATGDLTTTGGFASAGLMPEDDRPRQPNSAQ